MKRNPPTSPANIKYWLASGSMLALVGIMVDLRGTVQPPVSGDACQQIVQSQSVLSRDELSRLLNLPDRSSKESVRTITGEPYCVLPAVEIQAGATADREVYPLAFDPQTWFVALYEGNEYAGYSFIFQPN